MIGAVVPTFNRLPNLALLLDSMEHQSTHDFVMLVADDGSTDGTREHVLSRAATTLWAGRLHWIGCGPHTAVRTGRARNIGAANLPAECSLLLMLDSDLVLQPDAIAGFARLHARYPDHVICGQVDWLPPHHADTVRAHVHGERLARLRETVPPGKPARVEGTFTGPELRERLARSSPGATARMRPEWALPLNSGWPLSRYWAAGGFDESMSGYGYQDMELGARAARQHVECLWAPGLWALHVWHGKHRKAMVENQRNLDVYLRRNGDFLRENGFGDDIEIDVDWNLWWHYHRERGGRIRHVQGRLWAVSHDDRHALRLPDATWLPRLGHFDIDVDHSMESGLNDMIDHGEATCPPSTCVL